MDTLNHIRPRRVFDSRYDFNRNRGSPADEADRAIILRILDGVPQQYLIFAARGWRAELTANERDDDMIQSWYESIEKIANNQGTMKEVRVKADFYRERWNRLPEEVRRTRSLKVVVTCDLIRYSREKHANEARNVIDDLSVCNRYHEEFTDFERHHIIQDKLWDAAQRTYFEVTQPEAAEFLRKRAAAERLAEQAAAKDAGHDQREFDKEQEAQFQMRKRDAAKMTGKRKGPVVWPWEQDVAQSNGNEEGLEAPEEQDNPGAISG